MDRAAVAVIVVGAGAGRRLGGDGPKAFRPIGDRSMLAVATEAAAAAAGVRRVVAVIPAGGEDEARSALVDVPVPVQVVAGGAARQDSVREGLSAIDAGDAIVLVHDAARPFASTALFDRVISAVVGGVDGVVPVIPVSDTIVRVHGQEVVGDEAREELAIAQTPQGFRAGALREAHAKAEAAGVRFTDDATLVRWAGFVVRTVEGETDNRKITTGADLAEARRRAGGGDG